MNELSERRYACDICCNHLGLGERIRLSLSLGIFVLGKVCPLFGKDNSCEAYGNRPESCKNYICKTELNFQSEGTK